MVRPVPLLALITLASSLLLLYRTFQTVSASPHPPVQHGQPAVATGATTTMPQQTASNDNVATQLSHEDPILAAAVPDLSSPPPPPPSPSAARVASGHARRGGTSSSLSVTVGLNKGVYRFEKQRSYHCPAMGGGKCVFTTERSRFGEADALIDVLKDARRAGPLDFRVKPGQLKGVIISEQDKAKSRNAAFAQNGYDFEVGYNKRTATIWRPFMCNEINRKTNLTIAQVLLRGNPRARPPSAQGLNAGDEDVWPAQTGELAAFVSNCVGWRLEYLRELRKYVRLDSFGACAHNNDTCAKSGKHKCDKTVKAGAYKFVFAFENTEESHYVTEKVYTGLRSGAVPIYRGAPEVAEHVPEGSVIFADKFDSAKALGEHLRALLDDERGAYAAHHRWNLQAFAQMETVRQCPWQCRVCEHVAASRSKRLRA